MVYLPQLNRELKVVFDSNCHPCATMKAVLFGLNKKYWISYFDRVEEPVVKMFNCAGKSEILKFKIIANIRPSYKLQGKTLQCN